MYDETRRRLQTDAGLVTAAGGRANKTEEETLESSLRIGDGGVLHPHPLFAAPLCESDTEETFGPEEQKARGDGE